MIIPEMFETGFIIGFLFGGGAAAIIMYILTKNFAKDCDGGF